MTFLDPAIVRIENLNAYLREMGFEVVSGHWLRGEPYPVLYIRPKAQPAASPDLLIAPRCRCGHSLISHDQGCLLVGCTCSVYDPRLER